MLTEMNDFADWLNEQLGERGWGYNELARRAGVSGGSISNIMNLRKNPGYDVCMGIAKALGEAPETVLRLAGLLPPLPPAVEGEQEVMRLFRRLSDEARGVIVATMRNLLGMAAPTRYPALGESREPYRKPTVRELCELAAELTREERGELMEYMLELARQGDGRGSG